MIQMTYIQTLIAVASFILLSPSLASVMDEPSLANDDIKIYAAQHPNDEIFDGVDQTRLLFGGVLNGVLASTLFRVSRHKKDLDRKYIISEVIGLVSALMSGAGVAGIAYCYYADLGARTSSVTAWGVGSIVGFVADRIVPSAVMYFENKVKSSSSECQINND